MPWFFKRDTALSQETIISLTLQSAEEARARLCAKPKKVLLLPPDITRIHSGSGWITEILYKQFSRDAEVYVMPTLGQHKPHTTLQNKKMFGTIPEERILKHDAVHGVRRLGVIPKDYVFAIMDGKADWEIPISINTVLFETAWDIVISIGQVVPHEVLGFANHNKNYIVGIGGRDTIAATHMASACHGIENNMGKIMTPLRHCFNKAESEFLGHLPDYYILLVMANDSQKNLVHTGFYAGDDLDTYLMAAGQSMKENITIVPPLKKVVAYMNAEEYESTWVANKAIYRTCKAIADNGELIIIAPGLERFGEHDNIDRLIRTYGYRGSRAILEAWEQDAELKEMAHAAAHLIHGSSENRYTITYAPGKLAREDIENVGYAYMDIRTALNRYNPAYLTDGFNTLPNGEEIFFIRNPSAGLWSTKEKL